MPCVTNNASANESRKHHHIGFRAGPARKKAARLLAIELDFPDVTELMKWLLDREIAERYPQMMKQIEAEDPGTNRRQQLHGKTA